MALEETPLFSDGSCVLKKEGLRLQLFFCGMLWWWGFLDGASGICNNVAG